jgi:hypothetical protein
MFLKSIKINFFFREGERVSNPFSLPETLLLSANCLTLFRWFADSFFCRDFNFFSSLCFLFYRILFCSILLFFILFYLLFCLFVLSCQLVFFAAARVRTRGCGAITALTKLSRTAHGKNYRKSSLIGLMKLN